jgi:hypothetical protein
MILLIGLYRDRSPTRMAELLDCLGRNLANEHIAEVHVFLEDDLDSASIPALAHPKVRLVAHRRRLMFRDLFGYANRELPGRPVIVANNDIFFDHTLARLDGYPLEGRFLCLSRWDIQADGSAHFFDHPWSQDAWIFQAPAPEFPSDWHLGLPGCENRLAYEAQAAGLSLVNPSRTIRANHLHLSQVRHYVERQRLKGHGQGIAPSWLGTPWLWPVVTCMGRLDDVRACFGTVAAQPRSSPVLVDYACPEGTAAWVRGLHPHTKVVAVGGRHAFNAGEARNLGAAAADPDGLLCFLDADVSIAPRFADAMLASARDGCFLVPDASGPGLDSTLVCARTAFDRVGGFDANYISPAEGSADLRAALRRAGLTQVTFPASLLAHRGGHAPDLRARFAPLPHPDLAAAVDASYRRAKNAIAAETGDGVARSVLREVQRAIAHRHLVNRGLVPDAPCAAVSFREGMGYTVGRLVPGASSHNNDRRPFTEIPTALAGLAFTQVVSSRVSPVNVEFRVSGKLYVLVGTDWGGYQPATAYLHEHGYREPLPHVKTCRGTGFEVWSLLGEAGDALELPTQVMLVARELVAA